MVLTSRDKLFLKKLLKELKSYRALHTEFVTVYIPAGYNLDKIINHLSEEQGTASNIKSAITRKNVQAALEKMIVHLKGYSKTPENGVAVFCGNIAASEGKQDFKIWTYEPQTPLNTRIYRCDKTFVTDIIESALIDDTVYGLVVLDRRDAVIALLKGKSIEVLQKTHSEVPGKFKAGGQSAQRFARQREGSYKAHFKKVADYMKDNYLHLGNSLKGIIVGGPGTTVNSFLNYGVITGDIQRKIIGNKDLSYTGDFGLQELLDKSEDLLAAEEVAKEKDAMQKFLKTMLNDPSKAIYGEKEVLKALEMNAIGLLLVSDFYDEDKILMMEEKAQVGGTEVKVISTETREGVQLKGLGGIAAILRFPIG